MLKSINQRILFTFCLLFCCGYVSFAQTCTTLGQTPETAFPVCGTTSFQQTTVPICSTNSLFVPGCTGSGSANYENKNPFWYKFTCYQSGTLGFLITPSNLGDDYDWQLYDVTGLSPSAVLTNTNIIVTGNWSGSYGTTGTSSSGVSFIQCASNPADNAPRFAQMPNLIAGHDYILLVSHYTDSQSGYALQFSGGTAVITDPKLPLLSSAFAYCDGQQIRVVTNKKMRCNSLAADGSDFRVNISGIAPLSASSVQCTRGFDVDTLIVNLNAPLPPGTHKIYIKAGTDGNTLSDYCDRQIPSGDSLSFTVQPIFPTPLDSITPVKCAPTELVLVFKKRMQCSSITASGSEFQITGPSAVTVAAASGNCGTDGLSEKIYLTLASPIQVDGIYTVSLINGSDGNTIVDECGQPSLPGTINFRAYDTVSAHFTYNINYGCKENIVSYQHYGGDHINYWNWNFDNRRSSSLQNPVITYTDFANKTTRLIVNNGVCADTSVQTIVFDNYMDAAFTVTPILCPGDTAFFTNNSKGNITSYNWVFGNGRTSSIKDAPPQVYIPFSATDYIASPMLITGNSYGCYDTAVQKINIVHSCFVAVPSAFTPNGDGLNDYLYPLGAYKASRIRFNVFNRFGQRVFYSENTAIRWDGRFKGQEAEAGTYVWYLEYIDTATGKATLKKGYSILIR